MEYLLMVLEVVDSMRVRFAALARLEATGRREAAATARQGRATNAP